jgi:hypothetical protein
MVQKKKKKTFVSRQGTVVSRAERRKTDFLGELLTRWQIVSPNIICLPL